MIKIYTENSLYELDTEAKKVRRRLGELSGDLRKDGEWVRYETVEYKVGAPMILMLEHLSGDPNQATVRMTSYVTKVEQ